MLRYLEGCGDDFKIMVLPDHPTPLDIRTHSPESVPFFIYDPKVTVNGVESFSEACCSATDVKIDDGSTLLSYLIH